MYLKNHATQNTCDLELSNQFSSFFKSKIELIREKIDDGDSANFDAGISPATQDTFNSFEIAAVHEVQTLIDAMPNKTRVLDPVPTWLVKECSHEIAPFFTKIINASLTSGIFPSELKFAIVKPLLKRSNLDTESLASYMLFSILDLSQNVRIHYRK